MDPLFLILLIQVGVLPILMILLGAYIEEHPNSPQGVHGWTLLVVSVIAFFINLTTCAGNYSYIKNSKQLISRIPSEIVVKYLKPTENMAEPTPTNTPTNQQKINDYLNTRR